MLCYEYAWIQVPSPRAGIKTTRARSKGLTLRFADFEDEGARWITVVESDFYPDYLEDAKRYYAGFIGAFREEAALSSGSAELLRNLSAYRGSDSTQLMRIFRKYVSPSTSVEMLKRKRKIDQVIEDFGPTFRPIGEVREALESRPARDEVLSALLWEYRERGQKGYKLTEDFFAWFRDTFGGRFIIAGPERAGRDVILSEELEGFENRTPADFLIREQDGTPLVVGFARYDSDRGGAQEDDRIKGNRDNITDLLHYSVERTVPLKVLLLNDGPGLLLGSMWRDYSALEEYGRGDVMVATLLMLEGRFTEDWIIS